MAEQQPPAGPPPDSLVLSDFKGVRNTVTRERLAPDEWEKGVNVDLDDAGQPHRRRGYTRVATGNFHSLRETSRGHLVVKDGTLGWITPSYAFQSLSFYVGSDPVAIVEIADEIYFSSRAVSGVIIDNTVSPWGAIGGDGIWHSPVVNPTPYLPEIRGKLLGAPPLATELTYFNGRIYLAVGRTLWATELYLYRYIDKTRNFLQFEHDITFIGSVTDGIYVGTEGGVWFLSGTFREMRRTRVTAARGVPGSLVSISAEAVAPQTPQPISVKQGVLFLTEDGVCVGYDGGLCYNITDDRMTFPTAQRAAALFREQDGVSQYVGVTDSGGTPGSNARIGDYVDAEIRRFQGA